MRKDDARLLDIVLAAKEAQDFIRDVSRDEYLANRVLQNALCLELEIIGEAARTVSEEFKTAHAEIPWRDIVGLRNRIVHEYFRLDLNVIWEIVVRDLPPLVKIIEPFVPPET